MEYDNASFEYINTRYLLSVDEDQPQEILQPICGYNNEPLLSLEEACEPLLKIVPRLQAHIWVAKQNSKNPSDDLTEDESGAIRLYTMEWDPTPGEQRVSLYSHLNRTLKEVDRGKLRPWFRYLKLLLTALAKIPSSSQQTVWRGVKKDQSADYPPGAHVTWWGFSSCTKSLNVLESDLYLGKTGTRTLFSVEVFNGRAIRSHSHFTSEDEILLLPASYFEVRSRLNPAPGLFIIHLKQKMPPHQLLEPPFEGADIGLGNEETNDTRRSTRISYIYKHVPQKKTNKRYLALGLVSLLVLLIVSALLVIFLREWSTKSPPSGSDSAGKPFFDFIGKDKPPPLSNADVFYSFDDHTDDLRGLRNAKVDGGPISYVDGYIGYGKAVFIDQTQKTRLIVQGGLNLTSESNLTIEGFFLLRQVQMEATILKIGEKFQFKLTNSVLSINISTKGHITETVIATNQWHYFALVYDSEKRNLTFFVDGVPIMSRDGPVAVPMNFGENQTMIIGENFHGYFDQFAISKRAKHPDEIRWDFLTYCYYPFEGIWSADRGPNGLNLSSYNLKLNDPIIDHGINFNRSESRVTVEKLTVLSYALHDFAIALMVRLEQKPGVFLTIANENVCLLQLAFHSTSNKILTYFPNSTKNSEGVLLESREIQLWEWTHVAVSWTTDRKLEVYISGSLDSNSKEVTYLLTWSDENNGPMTATMGHYNGSAPCYSMGDANITGSFIGSIDEFYVFSSEVDASTISALAKS